MESCASVRDSCASVRVSCAEARKIGVKLCGIHVRLGENPLLMGLNLRFRFPDPRKFRPGALESCASMRDSRATILCGNAQNWRAGVQYSCAIARESCDVGGELPLPIPRFPEIPVGCAGIVRVCGIHVRLRDFLSRRHEVTNNSIKIRVPIITFSYKKGGRETHRPHHRAAGAGISINHKK